MTNTTRTITAHAPVHKLVTALARAGWGELAGREHHGLQKVLYALQAGREFRNEAGEGLSTVEQIAARASLSERWTRRCLARLEDVGVIVWRRGGVDRTGRPGPSWFRIVKTRLVAMILAGRPVREAAEKARALATRERLAAVPHVWGLRPKTKRSRRSVHAALSADPPPLTGEFSVLDSRVGSPRPWDNLLTCEHDGIVGRCPSCRRANEKADGDFVAAALTTKAAGTWH